VMREIGPLLKPNVALKNMKYLMDLSRKNGVTTTSELAFGVTDFDTEIFLFNRFYNSPAARQRCVAVVDGTALWRKHHEKAIDIARSLRAKDTNHLFFRGVKFFSDDSYLGLGMMIENPGYTDGRKGLFNVQPGKDMVDLWRPWWEAGFQIHVHTNGNAGNLATLDTLRTLQQMRPRVDHRFTVQHFGISSPALVRMLKDLGALASVNPYYVYYRAELTAPYIGTERAFTAVRLRSLVDAGVPTALHSDTPVGPPRPLEWVWIAVNRFGYSGQVCGPEERVTLDEALKMITVDAAYTLGMEKQLGSIEPGKWADFTVLEESPYEVAKEKIRDIPVWGTVVGGGIFPASEIKP
jgi:predicted amidohydrolase YtcJ